MDVIGAGFGRTGTSSTKVALEQLGFGPCYHMTEVSKNPDHWQAWSAARAGHPVDWATLFAGYRATLDWPACTHYRKLMRAFPDAKVLLTVRDPQQWYDSVLRTIYASHKLRRYARYGPPPASGPVDETSTMIWGEHFAGRFEDREHAISVFEAHNEAVARHVSPEKLLVFEVTQGWGPLCDFLGVRVPHDRPFPHRNPYAAWWRLAGVERPCTSRHQGGGR